MKAKRQILTACAVACALLCSSCGGTKPAPEPKPEEKTPFYAKEGSFLYLNVNETPIMKNETDTETSKGGDLLLSPLNIVKYSETIVNKDANGDEGNFAVAPEMRDVEHSRIKMWSEMVIAKRPHKVDGKRVDLWTLLDDGWIACRNVRLEINNLDPIKTDDGVVIPAETKVIAYIPNAKMDEAQKAIRKAWEAKDNEEVYRLFNEAFTFIPITNNEWEALKAKGEL